MRVFISASWKAIPWNCPIFCPKASRAGIFQAGFICRFGNAQRLGANADASRIQHGHGNLEAFAFLPQPVGDWSAVIFKNNLAGSGSSNPQLGLFLAAHKTGLTGIDHESGDAAVRFLRDRSW